MNAGRNEAERSRSSTVHVRFGVNLRSGIQQNFRNGHDILRRLLPRVFHTVG
jgi:hypothetical protein